MRLMMGDKEVILTVEVWKPHEIVWTNLDTDMPVSEPLVMKSGAGWYVGEVCQDPECGNWVVPYARCTDYYPTPELASEAL